MWVKGIAKLEPVRVSLVLAPRFQDTGAVSTDVVTLDQEKYLLEGLLPYLAHSLRGQLESAPAHADVTRLLQHIGNAAQVGQSLEGLFSQHLFQKLFLNIRQALAMLDLPKLFLQALHT